MVSYRAMSPLDTPAVTVDLDIMEANIRRVQAHLDRHGIANRPHIKTHKIPAIGRMQMAGGAAGITCQKLGEVEVFTDAGVADDVLLTFNILGRDKTDRLMALSRRLRRLAVVLDNEVVARGLSEAAASHGVDVPFLVECDTGFGRNGVQTPDEALELARATMRMSRMDFQGLMTFPNRDPGTRVLTSDQYGMKGFGHVVEYPEAQIPTLSEEHAIVDLSTCGERPRVGDVVHVIPNHCCVVSNMVDEVHGIRKGRLEVT